MISFICNFHRLLIKPPRLIYFIVPGYDNYTIIVLLSIMKVNDLEKCMLTCTDRQMSYSRIHMSFISLFDRSLCMHTKNVLQYGKIMMNIQQKHSNPAILRHDAFFVIFFLFGKDIMMSSAFFLFFFFDRYLL